MICNKNAINAFDIKMLFEVIGGLIYYNVEEYLVDNEMNMINERGLGEHGSLAERSLLLRLLFIHHIKKIY